MSETPATAEQPAPRDGTGPDAWLLVLEDMRARRAAGIERYGKPLRHDNGRDHLTDAYQEALDLAVYLRNEIEARKERERFGAIHSAVVKLGYTVITDSEENSSVVTIHKDRVMYGQGVASDPTTAIANAVVMSQHYGDCKLREVVKEFNLS
jgi:hypothetical protein